MVQIAFSLMDLCQAVVSLSETSPVHGLKQVYDPAIALFGVGEVASQAADPAKICQKRYLQGWAPATLNDLSGRLIKPTGLIPVLIIAVEVSKIEPRPDHSIVLALLLSDPCTPLKILQSSMVKKKARSHSTQIKPGLIAR